MGLGREQVHFILNVLQNAFDWLNSDDQQLTNNDFPCYTPNNGHHVNIRTSAPADGYLNISDNSGEEGRMKRQTSVPSIEPGPSD